MRKSQRIAALCALALIASCSVPVRQNTPVTANSQAPSQAVTKPAGTAPLISGTSNLKTPGGYPVRFSYAVDRFDVTVDASAAPPGKTRITAVQSGTVVIENTSDKPVPTSELNDLLPYMLVLFYGKAETICSFPNDPGGAMSSLTFSKKIDKVDKRVGASVDYCAVALAPDFILAEAPLEPGRKLEGVLYNAWSKAGITGVVSDGAVTQFKTTLSNAEPSAALSGQLIDLKVTDDKPRCAWVVTDGQDDLFSMRGYSTSNGKVAPVQC